MNVVFVAAATCMTAAATALLIYPMLRTGRAAGRLRGSLGWITTLSVMLPIGALGLYLVVGTPTALDPATYRPAVSNPVDDIIGPLHAGALKQPGELTPWLLLGRAAATMQRPDMALDALDHALQIAPDNPDVMVAYAEAVAAKRTDHRLDKSTRAVLEHAVGIDPRHQHGLLLLGVADYQDGRFAEAATRWKQLLALLPANSSIASAIASQIADAEARAPGN